MNKVIQWHVSWGVHLIMTTRTLFRHKGPHDIFLALGQNKNGGDNARRHASTALVDTAVGASATGAYSSCCATRSVNNYHSWPVVNLVMVYQRADRAPGEMRH